ncbi:MAG TPA: hypothetical protein VLN74_05805 [Ilumatobacteraceae bacterium]|nr:hypothetical protein [Ilumatobacteraceae bacterium]
MSDTSDEPVTRARRVAPAWAVWLLIVLATVVGMGATLNSWVDRQALDTDEWVSATDDMLADDDVRNALSVYLVDELFRTVDVAAGLESLLPGQTSQLAGPIAASLQSSAVGSVDQALGTERFRSLWSDANRTAHTVFVRVANGDDGALLATSGGALVVDLREMLIQVADRLGLPGAIVERIPEDAGRLVVFESDQLDAVQQAVRVINVLSLYLFILVVVLYAAAVVLASDRRVALRNVGVAVVVGSVLLLIAQRITIDVSVDQLARAERGRDAVAAIVSIATGLLNELAWAWLGIGVVIAAYAVLIGPTRAAGAARGFLAPVMSNPVGAWALALGVLALYLLLAPGISFDRWLPALVVVFLYVTAVELLRRQITREPQDARTHAEA